MLSRLVALVAPPACLTCGGACSGGAALCSACRRTLPWLRAEMTCPRCALPRPCGPPCPAAHAAFARAWAPVAHEGSARALVHALKFHGLLAAAHAMAAQIAANAPEGTLAPVESGGGGSVWEGALAPVESGGGGSAWEGAPAPSDAGSPWAAAPPAVVVPVPANPGRRRARGFDAAERLARALAKRTGLPLSRCLAAPATRRRQLGASRAARLDAPLAPTVRGTAPRRVVLVDDVHTTGATLDACARVLRENGTEWVSVVTYARTLR